MMKMMPAILITFALLMSSLPSAMADAVCATVKLELNQQLTLDRQAFDAHKSN